MMGIGSSRLWTAFSANVFLPPALHGPRFREEDYTVHVQLNDYLDIICPHYEDETVADSAMERYTLYMVAHQEYVACEPQSKDQVRWKCNQPSAKHGPEKLSEKFQRFTPFTLGKEFKEGHSYYYICECIRDRDGPECWWWTGMGPERWRWGPPIPRLNPVFLPP